MNHLITGEKSLCLRWKEKQRSLAFLSQRSQLRSHLLQSLFQLRAASAFLVQRCLHVAVLQRHRLDGWNRGHLAWTLTLALTLGLTLGLCSHGGQQILSPSPKQTLRRRELAVVKVICPGVTRSTVWPLTLILTFFFLEPP